MPISDLAELLRSMAPSLHDGVYCFAVAPAWLDIPSVKPVATLVEREGVSLVVEEAVAVLHGLTPLFRCAWITLTVHSDLNAVGLTAAVSAALADAGISCNVVAGAHNDHLFVPIDKAESAMRILTELSSR